MPVMANCLLPKMAAATALLLLLAALPAAVAVDYTVGGNSGWESGVNYDSWVKGKTFNVGDALVFSYGSTHSVDVVDKDGYDNCDGSKATDKFSGGNTRIELKKSGPMYFLCPTPGHCESGMKLSIDVKDSTSGSGSSPPSPPSTTTPSPPTASGTPGAGSTPRPPPSGNAATRGFMSYALLALSMVLGYLMF